MPKLNRLETFNIEHDMAATAIAANLLNFVGTARLKVEGAPRHDSNESRREGTAAARLQRLSRQHPSRRLRPILNNRNTRPRRRTAKAKL
jgi:hypothetical protein